MDEDEPVDRDATTAATLWATGGFVVRVAGPDGRPRVVRIGRPFAVVGRAAGADVRIESPGASLRHAYLHLDARRGVYAVDLASRTGLRIDGRAARGGWLPVGWSLEVAGWTVEVVEADAAGGGADAAGSPIEDEAPHLAAVTLVPEHDQAQPPQSLGSELVFLGRGAGCGLRVDDPAVARVHAVVVRDSFAAFAVDLVGSGLTRNGRPVRGATALADGDALGLGRARYRVRLGRPPTPPPRRPLAPALFLGDPGATVTMTTAAAGGQGVAPAAWALRAILASQAEMARRQDELRRLVETALREQSALLRESLEKMDRIDRELADLRAELRRSTAATPSATPLPALPPAPLRLPRLEPSESDSEVAPARSTDWILDRVQRLEEENRSTWRDLLGRLVPAVARVD